ncbi:MAG: YaaA family protein [Acholeplasmataceae bacterium]
MKILLSPAKLLNLDASFSEKQPVFLHEATQLKKALKSMSLKKTEMFFKLSHQSALLTQSYYANDQHYKALELFSGIAFKTFHDQSQNVSYDDLYILSGLYGIIQAEDGISPYRLDLIHPTRGSLIQFWKKRIYQYLKNETIIISCASLEYEQILDERLPITHVKILKGEQAAPSVDAKKVRGAFAHHLLLHHQPDGFSYDGYSYIKKDGMTIYIKK